MNRRVLVVLGIAAVGFCLARRSCAAQNSTLQTVSRVDLSRYAGLWYEIARYPNSFQRGCLGTTASYTLREDGKIEVVNRCRNEDGSLRQVKGKAWSVSQSNARLKVSFFWPFRGDYWIIALGENYDYAVVATPNRKLLWILSRSPQMEEALYEEIVQRLQADGFDPDKVLRTPQ